MNVNAAVVQSGLGQKLPKLLTRVQIPAAAPPPSFEKRSNDFDD